jgi:hypothetical protein
MRAHKSSISACRLRAVEEVKGTMMNFVARARGKVQANYIPEKKARLF